MKLSVSYSSLPDARKIGFYGQHAYTGILFLSFVSLLITGTLSASAAGLVVVFAAFFGSFLRVRREQFACATVAELICMSVADFGLLLLLLYASGGLLSPFGVLLLFPIALTFVFLESRFSVAVVAVSVACVCVLLQLYTPTVENAERHHIASHLYGMLLAFSLCTCFVVSAIRGVQHALDVRDEELHTIKTAPDPQHHPSPRISAISTLLLLLARPGFQLTCLSAACSVAGFFIFPSFFGHYHTTSTTHISSTIVLLGPVLLVSIGFICCLLVTLTRSLHVREQQLNALREKMQKEQLLTSLATLAAGTAHELCSPLTTIAIIAKELELQLAEHSTAARVTQDLQEIGTQVARCRTIIDRMNGYADSSALAGAHSAVATLVAFADLLTDLQSSVQRRKPNIRLTWEANVEEVIAPAGLITQVVQNLIDNAVDASHEGQDVHASFMLHDGILTITIRDSGQGMPSSVYERAGEPFFTTKEVGVGSGMGLFIVRSLAGRFGRDFKIESREGYGTTVTVELCLETFVGGAASNQGDYSTTSEHTIPATTTGNEYTSKRRISNS